MYKKNYFSGNTKLMWDILLCILFAFLLVAIEFDSYDRYLLFTEPLEKGGNSYIASKLDTNFKLIVANTIPVLINAYYLFFVIFFWSLNRENVKNKKSKIIITLLCLLWVPMMYFMLISTYLFSVIGCLLLGITLYFLGLSDYLGWVLSFIMIIWTVLIAVKYLQIMTSWNGSNELKKLKKWKFFK